MIYIFKFFDIQSNKPLEFEEDFSFVQLDIIKFDNKKKLSRIRNAGNINGANKTTNSTLKKQEKTNDEMPLNDITNDVIKEAIRLKYETIREIQDVYPQSIQNQKAYLICDHRPDDLPKIFSFESRLYTFQYLLKDQHLYKYQCKYGASRSKKNKCKCEACIGIPAKADNENIKDVDIVIINNEHTCPFQTKIIAKLLSETEIKQKVEKIFTSVKPRPSQNQLVSLLCKQIKEETPEGEEPQMFSTYLVSNYYSELCKKH